MAYSYETFDIVAVAEKCGLMFHSRQQNGIEYKAKCPFCDDRKFHLGLNRQKDMFHCFRCKEKGNSVSLYAKLHGITNKEAYYIIRNEECKLAEKTLYVPEEPMMPIRPLAERHDVYYDFLRLLRLNMKHQLNLKNRGLSFGQMHQFMYRSVPTDDVFRREILEKLSSMHDLSGIPGFYPGSNGEWEMYFMKCGGIYIPVCNHEGYIQGLQIRLDLPEDSKEDKYRWFSSKYFAGGTGARSWVHIVGDVNAHEACLTEGAIKADIASVLSKGKLFIAVPGVSSIAFLPEIISRLGITKVYEAFDMDKRAKPEVRKALFSLRETLEKLGVESDSCTWNPKYNGLDDYVFARSQRLQIAA